ncbi:MAG: presenilin family intramembrane aspartyl protease [Candidatus Woesearchaeota archaeon]
MKHTIKVTLILILIFLMTQVIGLYTVNKYIQVETNDQGKIVIVHTNTTFGPAQEFQENQKTYSFLFIVAAIFIMTALILLLIRTNLGRFWKYGFFFAVFIALGVAFGVFINRYIALAFALILAYFKAFRPNYYIHNLTEIFLYSGIAILVLPLFNLPSAFGLLILVSFYDMYAVWKSKHMIKLAKFQASNKVFAGLAIPYKIPKISFFKKKDIGHKTGKDNGLPKEKKIKSAILGGGDIGFTLIFAAVVMEHLIVKIGIDKTPAFFYSLIVALSATIALSGLFLYSKKNKFYPAMPFITIGCFIGYVIVILLI